MHPGPEQAELPAVSRGGRHQDAGEAETLCRCFVFPSHPHPPQRNRDKNLKSILDQAAAWFPSSTNPKQTLQLGFPSHVFYLKPHRLKRPTSGLIFFPAAEHLTLPFPSFFSTATKVGIPPFVFCLVACVLL